MVMEPREIARPVNIVTLTRLVQINVQKVNMVEQQEMAMDQAEEIVKEQMLYAGVMEAAKVYIIIRNISKNLIINNKMNYILWHYKFSLCFTISVPCTQDSDCGSDWCYNGFCTSKYN